MWGAPWGGQGMTGGRMMLGRGRAGVWGGGGSRWHQLEMGGGAAVRAPPPSPRSRSRPEGKTWVERQAAKGAEVGKRDSEGGGSSLRERGSPPPPDICASCRVEGQVLYLWLFSSPPPQKARSAHPLSLPSLFPVFPSHHPCEVGWAEREAERWAQRLHPVNFRAGGRFGPEPASPCPGGHAASCCAGLENGEAQEGAGGGYGGVGAQGRGGKGQQWQEVEEEEGTERCLSPCGSSIGLSLALHLHF